MVLVLYKKLELLVKLEKILKISMNSRTKVVFEVDLEDAESADETFSILMGDKVEPRRKFIEKNLTVTC